MTKIKGNLEDLSDIPEHGKAELVDGEIIIMPPTGFAPGYAGGEIFASLRDYARRTGLGYALPDNVGFNVNLPNRQSFSPDVSFYTGKPTGGKFLNGAPIFAVEIRSEGDYGPKADQQIANKRQDYFAAGTQVVWDVDVLRDRVVRVYRVSDPENPKIYYEGENAEAEPVLPGWSIAISSLFP